MRENGSFDALVMCNILRLEYDFTTKFAKLFIPEDDATDGPGTIAMFKAIDAKVSRIYVYAGKKLDIVYDVPENKASHV